MIVSINSEKLIEIFAGGTKYLGYNKALVDSLNVFPVPDGDTGTNMFLTMQTTTNEINKLQNAQMIEVCSSLKRGALKGARGNSGVILSQILKGMAEVFAETEEITTRNFSRALKNGAKVAYDVVTKPQEGTILTVIRLMSEHATKISARKDDFIEYFQIILKKGEEILADTPNLLPVLQKAGVVDAGGKGLLTIFYGMYNVLANISIPDIGEVLVEEDDHNIAIIESENIEDIKFAYCTEFFVINLFKKVTTTDIDKLRNKLLEIGDSVLVVGDLEFVKVHVHTNRPDTALGYGLTLGEINSLKIDNMLEQHRQIIKKTIAIEEAKIENVPLNAALVAISNGQGIDDIFKELGANMIIQGGQTMNPSVEDIVIAVESINAKIVYILPNNSNIILAASQAKDIVKTNLVVIPSTNIPKGIIAAINFNPGLKPKENLGNMISAMDNIKTGLVTQSIKNTHMDGFDLLIGDYIAIRDRIVAKDTNLSEVLIKLLVEMIDDESSSITLYYGADMSDEEANTIRELLEEKYPFFDVFVHFGGQKHYQFYISVE